MLAIGDEQLSVRDQVADAFRSTLECMNTLLGGVLPVEWIESTVATLTESLLQCEEVQMCMSAAAVMPDSTQPFEPEVGYA